MKPDEALLREVRATPILIRLLVSLGGLILAVGVLAYLVLAQRPGDHIVVALACGVLTFIIGGLVMTTRMALSMAVRYAKLVRQPQEANA